MPTYWSIAALLVAVGFLAYRHPERWRHRPSDGGRTSDRNKSEANTSHDLSFKCNTDGDDNSPPTQTSTGRPSEKVDEQSTPKASFEQGNLQVPTFSLDDGSGNTSEEHETDPVHTDPNPVLLPTQASVQSTRPSVPSPRTPAKPSAPNNMRPPSQPVSQVPSTANMMPPPARPQASKLPSTPTATTSLRVPSTGPLPNRGLPANSPQRASGGLTVNGTAVSAPNPRGKVLLSPGHSPMDWAALTRRGNLSGVSSLQRVTPTQLKTMTGRKGKPAWSSWQNRVYNITPYLPFHPGGEAELMKAAGRDGTKLFMDVHPWVNWDNMLGNCLVGFLVPEEHSPLEDMD